MSSVEDLAIRFVLDYERAEGRVPSDTRRLRGAMADIESPPRTIEVKAAGGSARGVELWLEPRQYEAAKKGGEFYVYVVDNVAMPNPAQFRLHVLGGARLASLLQRAKQQMYYLVPWPVAEYDDPD